MRADSAEMADPELTVAAAHLQVCARCQEIVSSRQDADRAISSACRDIPVPVGLEERLLGAVDAELMSLTTPSDSTSVTEKRPKLSRRRWTKRVAVAAACALCLTVGWWALMPGSSVTSAELTFAAVAELTTPQSRELFQGSFKPEKSFPVDSLQLPASFGMFDYRQLPISSQSTEAALSSFSFIGRRGRTIRGALLIARASDVQPLPTATSMSIAATVYERGFSIKSWHAGDFVYVCLVEGDEASLLQLQRDHVGRTT